MDAVVDDTFLCRTIQYEGTNYRTGESPRGEQSFRWDQPDGLRWEQRELDWPVGDWYRGGRVQSLRWEQWFWWKFVGSRIGNPLIS